MEKRCAIAMGGLSHAADLSMGLYLNALKNIIHINASIVFAGKNNDHCVAYMVFRGHI